MDKKRIIAEINYDIERGVYEQFPKLKNRLIFIADKLFKTSYIINSDAQLTKGELQTLKENDYLDPDEEI